ncbi:DUF6114 domain-containing protein [Actinacidiphila rubida]|uniref:Integral membrane protein n=1 Tax=Actinacidiphila rubida TaxID=310780 RepID=A0A1H8N1H8_9ACTN|nr:DUF6114 domain-containing protein [Actinacidiphila rubida]SEO23353.1 hypothetical protein SAMN05216267_1020149 [Actinacidiphila rubida]
MSAESTGLRARIRYGRLTFRHWRWGRPFWAGLLTIVAGVPIAYFPYANLSIGQLTVRMATTAGSGSLIIGVLLFVLGLTMWFQSAVRIFAGVAAILLSLVSLVISNFGGFLVGFLCALLGGALAVSWAAGTPATDEPGEKAERPDGLPDAGGDGFEPVPGLTDAPAVPAQAGDPFARPEPVPTGAGGDDDTIEKGRHRAG